MEYRVLGPLEVYREGTPVDLGGRRQRALLVLLLLNADQAVSFERLIDELWAGRPPSQATSNLQCYISNLRRALERNRTAPVTLLTRGRGYVLRVGREELDAHRFERLASAGSAALAAGEPERADQLLGEALGLWRGDALSDVAREAFAQAEIARLTELRLGASADRVDAALALGRHQAAVAELERLVVTNPLCERFRGQLMVALYRCGRQAEALRVYQEARETLVEGLGIEPSTALQCLEHQVLIHDPSLDWDVGRGQVSPASPPAEVAQPRPQRWGDLVGRHAEMTSLGRALVAASSGHGRLVLIAGDAGIGKSRLAEELGRRAADAGAAVAWGRCYEQGASPFWPWIEVIRSMLDQTDPSIAAGALRPGAAEIGQVVPEIKTLVPEIDPSPPLDPDEARLRLYDAVTGCLKRLAQHRPLVVVLDDLHWADLPSLRLLGFLATHLHGAGLLVVATYRDTDVEPGSPLGASLGSLARQPVLEHLSLSGLSSDEVRCLVVDALGSAPSEALVAALHDRSGGNPFFLTQLVRLFVEQGAVTDSADFVANSEVPLAVREVIGARLARLPAGTGRVLEAAAVIGGRFRLAVLEQVLGFEEDQVLELVERAVCSGIVVPDTDALDSYRFSHPLIHETLYQGSGAISRARLHGQVGAALERLDGGDSQVIEMAHHFWKAVPAGQGERALEFALRAAERAIASLAYEEAEVQFDHALRLLAAQPASPERDRRELEVLARQLALLTMTSGYGAPVVGAACRRALELCRQVGSGPELLPALWGLWSFSCVRADFDAARELAGQLLGEAERSGLPAFAVAGHQGLGVTSFHQGRLEEARHHLARGSRLSDALADPALAEVFHQDPGVACRSFEALVLWLLGDPHGAHCRAREAMESAKRLDQPFTSAFVHFFHAWLAVLAKEPATVLEHTEVAITLSRQRGFRLFAAMAAVLRAWAGAQRDNAELAWRELEGAVAACADTGTAMLRPFFLTLLAEAQWRAGLGAAALASAEQAAATVEASGERFYEPEVHRLRAELTAALWPQRAEEAERHIRGAVAVAEAQGSRALGQRATATLAAITGI